MMKQLISGGVVLAGDEAVAIGGVALACDRRLLAVNVCL